MKMHRLHLFIACTLLPIFAHAAQVSSVPDGGDATQGSISDAAAAAGGTGTLSAKLRLMTSQLGRIPAQGAAAPSASTPVTLANDVAVNSSTGQSALNLDLLTETSNGWYDVRQYRGATFQLIGSAGISAGAVTIEATNDSTNASAGVLVPTQNLSSNSAGLAATAITVAANTATTYVVPQLGVNFVRARISTAFVGGTVRVAASFSSIPLSVPLATVLVNGNTSVIGSAAEDASTTAAPVMAGCIARTTLPASTIIAGDAVRLTCSVGGQVVMVPFAPRDLWFAVQQTITTSTQTAIRAAQAAGIRSCITAIIWQNTSATATLVTIQDGASTTLYQFNATANMAMPSEVNLPTPICGTAATALNYTAATTGSNVLLTTTGFSSF